MVETFYISATLQSTLFGWIQVSGIYRFHHIPSFPPVFGLDQGSHKTHSGLQQSHHVHHAQYRYKCCRSGTHHTHPSCPNMSSDGINGRPKLTEFSYHVFGLDQWSHKTHSGLQQSHHGHYAQYRYKCRHLGTHHTHPSFPTMFSNWVHGCQPSRSSPSSNPKTDPENIHQIHIRFHVPFFITKIATPEISPCIPPITYDFTGSERRSPKYIPDLGHLPSWNTNSPTLFHFAFQCKYYWSVHKHICMYIHTPE